MIDYDHRKWRSVTFVLQGTVLSALWPRIVGYSAYAGVIWAGATYGPFQFPEFGTLAHSLVGVAMGMLLVFRTNAAYDRYWEGRKRWGAIINTSRNLVRSAHAHVGDVGPLPALVHAYALSLKQHLRRSRDLSELEDVVGQDVVAKVSTMANPPAHLSLHMSVWVAKQVKDRGLNIEVARILDGYIGALLDHQGACERILKTPVPFVYVAQVRQLLMVYLLTLPIVMVPQMGVVAVFVTAMVCFALLGIEEAGVEIEDPFGQDLNDLPLEAMCATIGTDVRELGSAVV